MKREILFKGKRVDNGEWVEGGYHKISDDVTLIIHKHYNNLAMNSEVYPETVCQFTGLIDKNGIRIFEHDIDKSDSVIKWWHERALFGLFYDFSEERPDSYPLFSKELEIIGNIHD